MQQIVVTPKVFFDLFILCLFWQGDYSAQSWTTVDKVARILYNLRILTKKQRSNLYKDGRLQLIFLQSISRFHPESETKLLFLHLDHAIDINRRRLLRDYRFSLTRKGCDYARSIVEEYSPIITQKIYIAENERQKSAKPKSISAVMKQYYKKLEEELEEE